MGPSIRLASPTRTILHHYIITSNSFWKAHFCASLTREAVLDCHWWYRSGSRLTQSLLNIFGYRQCLHCHLPPSFPSMGPLCWLLQLEQLQNCEEGRYQKQLNLHRTRQQGAAPTQQTDLSDKDPLVGYSPQLCESLQCLPAA